MIGKIVKYIGSKIMPKRAIFIKLCYIQIMQPVFHKKMPEICQICGICQTPKSICKASKNMPILCFWQEICQHGNPGRDLTTGPLTLSKRWWHVSAYNSETVGWAWHFDPENRNKIVPAFNLLLSPMNLGRKTFRKSNSKSGIFTRNPMG